jgi:hypothetical protein
MLYKSRDWHYFLADLCYVVNFALTIFLLVLPWSRSLFIAVYALANGPVVWAVYAWRNSMVFHSMDKSMCLEFNVSSDEHLDPSDALYSCILREMAHPN